jgi:hypothetical protein
MIHTVTSQQHRGAHNMSVYYVTKGEAACVHESTLTDGSHVYTVHARTLTAGDAPVAYAVTAESAMIAADRIQSAIDAAHTI